MLQYLFFLRCISYGEKKTKTFNVQEDSYQYDYFLTLCDVEKKNELNFWADILKIIAACEFRDFKTWKVLIARCGVLLSISVSDHLARSVACRKVARSAGVTGTAREGRNEAL